MTNAQTAYQIGEIVQVDPQTPNFGGCMVVVTEPKAWGLQGYVQSVGVQGQHYIRLRHDQVSKTGGVAEWIIGDSDEQPNF